jgi:hypothetical protein
MIRPMRSATLVVALAALLAACGAPLISQSPTTPAATPVPSKSAVPPEAIAPTRICEAPPEGEALPITCTEAIGKVLLALGPDATFVQAAWFRPGAPCPPNARCIAPPPGSAYVVARLGAARTGIIRLTTEGGEVILGAPEDQTFEIWPASGQAIPAVGRPDVGPGAPPEVVNRDALPLCGEERVGVFDRRLGRNCFLGAVQDGRAAELASQEVDAAGDLVVVLYRFAGRGPVLVYRSPSPVGAGRGWVRGDCAIGPAFDDELIFVLSECLSTELS